MMIFEQYEGQRPDRVNLFFWVYQNTSHTLAKSFLKANVWLKYLIQGEEVMIVILQFQTKIFRGRDSKTFYFVAISGIFCADFSDMC